MSGIFGWLGPVVGPHSVESVIESMARSGRLDKNTAIRSAHAGNAAVAASASTVSASVARHGDLLVAVQGEIRWIDAELAQTARESGVAAAAAGAYVRYGIRCLDQMRGPFAIAVIDTRSNSALLAIDRMGVRGMCFSLRGDRLVFGTRADQVIGHPDVPESISKQGIFNYLYCHMVPSPGTIFEGVSKLLPGERLVLNEGKLRRDFYWKLAYFDQPGSTVVELEDRFRALVQAGVERAVRDEAVGTFLSGGTDSSTVTGMLARVQGRPSDTYSIGFEAEGFDEMEYARITAHHFGCRTHEYYVTPRDLVDAIPQIAAACDEPFGNASAVAAYCCARMARADGKRLLLAGDGGDEIFGGNARYAKQKIFEAYWLLPLSLRRHLVEPLALGIPGTGLVPPLRKLQSYIRQARVPLPDRLETYNFLEREPLDGIFEPDFVHTIDPGQPAAIAREVYQRTASRSTTNRMMHLDLKQTLADNDLRKVNVACELAGVAVGYPLLDDDLVEFSGHVPPEQKVQGLKLRFLFKHALKDFLPPETISKSKHGFGLPFGVWLENAPELRALVGDSLGGLRSRGFVRPSYIDQLNAMHGSGHASYYGVMIWVLVMLEQWLRAREA